MITHIEGKLVEKNPTDVVIDCNGVGYFINISLHTFSQIPNRENIKLYTYLQVREDSNSLYGFSSKTEREIFKLLISVSGIGANIARTMLSSLTPEQVKEAGFNSKYKRYWIKNSTASYYRFKRQSVKSLWYRRTFFNTKQYT